MLRNLPNDSRYEFDVRQGQQFFDAFITVPPDDDEIESPIETTLELASRIDLQRYEVVIAYVEAVTSAAEYNAKKYCGAISAVTEASEARFVLERLIFMNLLKRQVMSNDPSLGFTQVRVEDFSDTSTFKREHLCSDGGSYLAVNMHPLAYRMPH